MWQTCPCLSKPFIAGVLGLAVLRETALAQSPPVDPLPPIQFLLELDAPMYLPRLGANAATLKTIFSDSVQRMFESRFRFLGWRKSGSIDTLIVHVGPSGKRDDKNLYLKIRLNRLAQAMDAGMFEPYSDVFAKHEDLNIETIAADWCRLADSIVVKKAEELLNILGQLPIKAKVELTVYDTLRIDLRPDAIRLASTETAPGFRVSADVSDPASGATRPTRANLDVFRCLATMDSFLCTIEDVTYGGFSYPQEKRAALVKRVLLGAKALYVRQYRAELPANPLAIK